ncbi:MAG TPA: DUF2779 domain-containing protein, partial [Gemmatimonadota bacterium]|nr:DUF2779 domain-containing protein [Gemmatimonadota bacterium]
RAINGPRPDSEIGLCCYEPRECPFLGRCWPEHPHDIRSLHGVGPKKAWDYLQAGVRTIDEIPADQKLSAAAQRQRKALETGELIVEPGLAQALQPFSGRLGYLDFETVARALPVWLGTAPWGTVSVQFSYHEEQPDGKVTHAEHLAEGPGDPRRPLAEALVAACAGAERIAMYTSYERTRIRELQRAVPELAGPLAEIDAKLIDLKKVIADNIYHPEFNGSFSIKDVLTPLVPDLSYEDLPISDGMVASVEIARLLLAGDEMSEEERARLRDELLQYCEQDTWAMVLLVRRLRELAGT